MPTQPKTKAIYSNHVLQAPDGTPISRIGSDRSEWYVERGLARVVCEDPYTIRLTFEPAGRGHAGDDYYLADKENKCVVCGAEDEINKHHVIPRLYRRHMPEHYKDRTSHDVVVLCIDCHVRYEKAADERKRQYIRDLGGELGIRSYKELPSSRKRENDARKSAIALLRHRGKMPDDRVRVLEDRVREILGEDLNDEKLAAFVDDGERPNRNDMSGMMASHVLKFVNLDEFCRSWRRHFVSTMQPKYLPSGWGVDRPLCRDDQVTRRKSPL